MSARVALDTNILAYAAGVGDKEKRRMAIDLVETLPVDHVILPAQVLGEFYRVLTGKANRSASAAQEMILAWADAFTVADSTWDAFQSAFSLSADHGLQVWDALILSVAAETRCRVLISEDLQDGFTWRGVTVVDPFHGRHKHLIEFS